MNRNKALLIMGALGLGLSAESMAGPVYTLADNYWGGNNYYNPANGDSIGGSPFTISAALASRLDDNRLQITIETDYAGYNGLENTYYGDLFLNATWAAQSRPHDDHYSTDTYQPGDWSFAVHLPSVKNISSNAISGNAGFYAITDTSVVQSQVDTCTDSYPNDSSCRWYYRSHQAVSIDPNASVLIDGNATWRIDPKKITFTFNDQGKLGDEFALSWSMTCANDVIQGVVNAPFVVPEPSTIFLTSMGSLGLGFTRRRLVR